MVLSFHHFVSFLVVTRVPDGWFFMAQRVLIYVLLHAGILGFIAIAVEYMEGVRFEYTLESLLCLWDIGMFKEEASAFSLLFHLGGVMVWEPILRFDKVVNFVSYVLFWGRSY